MAIEAAQGHLARSLLNTPVPVVRRTPRELVCLGVGVWILISELQQPARGWFFQLNVTLAVVFTCAFFFRFFLARLLAMAAAFSAGAQWWIGRQTSWETPLDLNWRAYACFLVVGVLVSSDLVRRFDRGRVPRWWPNPWADLERSRLAMVRWSLYLLCMLTALIHQGYSRSLGTPVEAALDWIPLYTAAVGLVLLALALGRRPALLGLPVLYLWALFHLIPRPAPPGKSELLPPVLLERSAHVTQPALVLAAVGLALSAWIGLQLLRRRLE